MVNSNVPKLYLRGVWVGQSVNWLSALAQVVILWVVRSSPLKGVHAQQGVCLEIFSFCLSHSVYVLLHSFSFSQLTKEVFKKILPQ